MPHADTPRSSATLTPDSPAPRAGRTIVAPTDADPPATDAHEAPAAPATTWPVADAPPGPRPLKRGSRLGRWVLDRPLGEGATATVWSAQHAQLGAAVAIKVFHRRDLPFQAVLGEAQAAAGILSPHAVYVHDVDVLDGHPCIVMERIGSPDKPARSLREVGDVDPREAARWVADAARGVAAAHEARVFHKDVKPANILVSPLDHRARISDFGLANPLLFAVPPHRAHAPQSTVALSVEAELLAPASDPCAAIRGTLRLGTPEFMAPEQAAGLRRDLDPHDPDHAFHLAAIDIYGLGATLWALLAGRPPYPRSGADPEDTDAEALMDEVVAGPPEPLGQIAPRAPTGLVRIVARAMARDPRDRHPSAAALADDLERWLAHQPTSVDRTALARARVHLGRERARVGTVVVFAGLVAGSSALVWQNTTRLAAQADEIAVQERRIADQRDALAAQAVQLGALQELSDERGAELAKTRTTLRAKEARLSEQLDALRSTSTALEGTQRNLTETQAALDAVQAQLDQTEALLAVTRDARDAADARIVLLGEELAAVRSERDAAADARDDLTARLATRDAELAATARDLKTATAAAADARARVEALQAERTRLEASLAAARTDRDQLAREVDAYRTQVAQLRAVLTPAEPAPPGP